MTPLLEYSRKPRDPERDAAIAARFKAGETMEAIGASFDPPLTRERVRQLVKRAGVKASEGGRSERIRQQGGTVVDLAREAAARRFLASYGCKRNVARALNGGRRLDEPGSDAWNYANQRARAITRGLRWRLTFPQWLEAWRASGHYEERGRKAGGYVMTRQNFDRGFEPGNVRICTFSEMSTAANVRRWSMSA